MGIIAENDVPSQAASRILRVSLQAMHLPAVEGEVGGGAASCSMRPLLCSCV